jgi:hypothetical protein
VTVARHSRLVAGVLAAIWLLVPVAAAVHGTVEAHEYCAEHQAFEHIEDGVAAVAGHHTTSVGSSRDLHEACELGDAILRTAVSADAGIAAVVDASAPAASSIVAIAGPCDRAVLDVAPKTSPPAMNV